MFCGRAVAQHGSRWRRHAPQRSHCLFRPEFLKKTDNGIEHHNGKNGIGLDRITDHAGDHRRDKQNYDKKDP